MNYDKKYSKKEFYWGLKPNNLVTNSIKYLPSNAKILDLGCGEGKDSFYLAKNKFDVTAIDISKTGIIKLKDFSKKEKLKIKAKVSDIKSYLNKCKTFDAIYAINILQFIDEKNIFKIIKKIKSKTKKKGINVISGFIAKNKKEKELASSKNGYAFDKKELKDIYKDWKIIFYEEKLSNWETHGKKRHRHFVVKLIAKKE